MGALSPWHLILLLVVALLVLGPGKLPEAGAAIGKAVREFQDAMEGRDDPAAPGPTGQAANPGATAPQPYVAPAATSEPAPSSTPVAPPQEMPPPQQP